MTARLRSNGWRASAARGAWFLIVGAGVWPLAAATASDDPPPSDPANATESAPSQPAANENAPDLASNAGGEIRLVLRPLPDGHYELIVESGALPQAAAGDGGNRSWWWRDRGSNGGRDDRDADSDRDDSSGRNRRGPERPGGEEDDATRTERWLRSMSEGRGHADDGGGFLSRWSLWYPTGGFSGLRGEVSEMSESLVDEAMAVLADLDPAWHARLAAERAANPESVRQQLKDNWGPWFYAVELKRRDPMGYDLNVQDRRYWRQTADLLAQYRAAKESGDATQVESLGTQIETLAREHFDVRQTMREHDLKQLDARLASLRQQMQERRERKEQIVGDYLNDLLDKPAGDF